MINSHTTITWLWLITRWVHIGKSHIRTLQVIVMVLFWAEHPNYYTMAKYDIWTNRRWKRPSWWEVLKEVLLGDLDLTSTPTRTEGMLIKADQNRLCTDQFEASSSPPGQPLGIWHLSLSREWGIWPQEPGGGASRPHKHLCFKYLSCLNKSYYYYLTNTSGCRKCENSMFVVSHARRAMWKCGAILERKMFVL